MCTHSMLIFFPQNIHFKEKLHWCFLWLVTYEKLFRQNLSDSHWFSSVGLILNVEENKTWHALLQKLPDLLCLAKDCKVVHQPLRICPYCKRSLTMVLHHSTPPHCSAFQQFISWFFFSLYRCFAAQTAALLGINCVFRSLFFQTPKGFCAYNT